MSLLAISTDDLDGVAAMNALIASAFPIVRDPDASIVGHLDLIDPFELRAIPVALPAVFLVDAAELVRYHYIGSAPEDRPRTELLMLAAERLVRRKC